MLVAQEAGSGAVDRVLAGETTVPTPAIAFLREEIGSSDGRVGLFRLHSGSPGAVWALSGTRNAAGTGIAFP